MRKKNIYWFFSLGLTTLTGIIVFLYIVLSVIVIPQIGISFSPYDGIIFSVLADEPAYQRIEKGDRIVAINGISFQDYVNGSRPSLDALLGGKNQYQIAVDRDGRIIEFTLTTTKLDFSQYINRLIRISPAIFYLFYSLIILLSMRPIDRLWFVINNSFNLTAILIASGTVFVFNLLYSAYIFRIAAWMCIPLFLHTSFFYPKPIWQTPKLIIGLVYGFFGILAGAEIFQLLPPNLFLYSLITIIFLCMVMVGYQAWQVQRMRNVLPGIILLGSSLFLLSFSTIGVTGRLDSPFTSSLLAYSMSAIPMVAIYSIYKHNYPRFELRINRIFTFVLFLLILLSAATMLIGVSQNVFLQSNLPWVIIVGLIAVGAAGGAMLYPRFSRWTEKHIFNIPYLPDQIFKFYAGRIVGSLDKNNLSALLCNEVFPSILVRQAAVFHLNGLAKPIPIVLYHINVAQMPTIEQINRLLKKQDQFVFPGDEIDPATQWIHLVLPLTIEGKNIGVCLLGRRDPDDFYSASEIPFLNSLMDQTALALNNIELTEKLKQYHLANIERQEAERKEIARELHDNILGQLAILMRLAPDEEEHPEFFQTYQAISEQIRNIVHGLRPIMISYGLKEAFSELADDLSENFTLKPTITIHGFEEDFRYPPETELHIFRIIEQACRNSILNGEASFIQIAGEMQQDHLVISVIDNGKGFHNENSPDFHDLVSNRHFGLAGMYERAILIGGTLSIESNPDHGTKIQLSWESSRAIRSETSTD